MLNKDFLQLIENKINKQLSESIKILNYRKLHGGSVNFSYQLTTTKESLFVKINHRKTFPLMFQKEIDGLNSIRSFFAVPNIICQGEYLDFSFLVLEFIDSSNSNKKYWEKFGEQLALMHQSSSKLFGYKEDNYNGSLKQVNAAHATWSDFFVENRLRVQCKMARDNQVIDNAFVNEFEKIYPKVSTIFPIEKPSLLHGDLWSGNYIIGESSTPYLIDPAVYYGHREMDIAMSLLFGGFDKQLYEIYELHFPLEKGWQKRVDIANIYPLMVHVNLFGSNYAQRVKTVIKRLI